MKGHKVEKQGRDETGSCLDKDYAEGWQLKALLDIYLKNLVRKDRTSIKIVTVEGKFEM